MLSAVTMNHPETAELRRETSGSVAFLEEVLRVQVPLTEARALLARDEKRLFIEELVNPHAFPSRMTIGMLVESMAGKYGSLSGYFVDSTPFESVAAGEGGGEEEGNGSSVLHRYEAWKIMTWSIIAIQM